MAAGVCDDYSGDAAGGYRIEHEPPTTAIAASIRLMATTAAAAAAVLLVAVVGPGDGVVRVVARGGAMDGEVAGRGAVGLSRAQQSITLCLDHARWRVVDRCLRLASRQLLTKRFAVVGGHLLHVAVSVVDDVI